MKKCLVSGSFDPITTGHLEIISKASKLFDKVIVGVFINEDKQYLFDFDERVELCKCAVKNLANVEVIGNKGMVCDFCKSNGVDAIVRGFRNSKDYRYESEMAKYNYDNCGVMTYLLPSEKDLSQISSSLVRKLINDIDKMEDINCGKSQDKEANTTLVELEKYLPKSVVEHIRRIKKHA